MRVAAGKPDHIAEMLAIQLVLDGLDAEQVLVAQRIVEVAAVGMAARSAQAEDIAAWSAHWRRPSGLCEQPDAFTAASMAFHAAVGEASANRFLSIMMQAVALALEQLTAPDTTVEVAKRVVASHRKLLHAIKAGDETASVQLISRHLDRVHAHVRRRLAAERRTTSAKRSGRDA